MTLKQWERRLVNSLKGLSKQERQTALEYYREIYGDKLDAGYTGEEIVEEFGSPEECAKNILSDSGYTQTVMTNPKEKRTVTVKEKYSAGAIVGLVCMTLLLIIPLYAVIVSVIAAFASCVIAGGACVLGGGAYFLLSPFYFGINGAPFGGVIANMGTGIALTGVGFLLFVGFYFPTKYTTIGAIKLFKLIYFRRTKQ